MNFDVKMDMLNALRGGMSMDEVAKMLTQQINDAKATYDKEQEEKKLDARTRAAKVPELDAGEIYNRAVSGKTTAEDVATLMCAYALTHTDMTEEEVKDIYTAQFVEQVFNTANRTMNALHFGMSDIDSLMTVVSNILNNLNTEVDKIKPPAPKEPPRAKVKTNMTPEEADWAIRKFLDGLR